MVRKRIKLSDESLENNRAFLEGLFSLNADKQFAYFTRLPYGGVMSNEDPAMTLETFSSNMRDCPSGLTLWFEEILERAAKKSIVYLASSVRVPNSQDLISAHWSAPHTDQNYGKVAELFSRSYGRPILSAEEHQLHLLEVLASGTGATCDYAPVQGGVLVLDASGQDYEAIDLDAFLALRNKGLIEKRETSLNWHQIFRPSFRNPVDRYAISDAGKAYLKKTVAEKRKIRSP